MKFLDRLCDYAMGFVLALLAGVAAGLGPGMLLGAIFVRCPFPFCVSPELHEDDHDVRVPIERFTPFREQAELFKSSGGGQLALSGKVSSSATVSWATSPLRKKMRRHA